MVCGPRVPHEAYRMVAVGIRLLHNGGMLSITHRTFVGAALVLGARLSLPLAAQSAPAPSRPTAYDLILRGGLVLDGTGASALRADVGISGSRIARIGDLSSASARTVIDVRGLMVAPGFINLHSHAVPAVLPTAENMLTQGVTTEILNADGSSPLDIGAQLDTLAAAGLAENVGASVGFNTMWANVMGPSDRRPTPADITRMQALIVRNLERGAFGVSAGLDYKPAYFATTDEVVRVLSPARPWRTFLPNHDRLTPEAGFSSRKGMDETVTIGVGAGLVPVFTHMKVQGHEGGTADSVLAMMRRTTARGQWVAADVYPYLAGQTALAALIIPGWAQDGGVAAMRQRFADPVLRARIITEADAAIAARFTGPRDILLNESGRRLSEIMAQQGLTSPGAAVVKVLETEFPSAILSFGLEEDLRKILQYPDAAIACDCGAWTATRAHPRGFGTFPRILGHYVRETHTLTWADAVRKMSGLPAVMAGMVDRGFLSEGMFADITVFDSATVIDHATYERPDAKSDGIRVVLVHGVVALRDGVVTGARGGQPLRRSKHMPSRPLRLDVARRVSARGTLQTAGATVLRSFTITARQEREARTATGRIQFTLPTGETMTSVSLGLLQSAPRWASVSGWLQSARGDTTRRAFTLVIDGDDPFVPGTSTTIELFIEGLAPLSGTLAGTLSMSDR